jgi:hypothetical protein
MTRPAYSAQIEDLEDAIVRCPEYRRALVLQQVTNLFLDDNGESVGKLDHLDDVLVCLMRPATAEDLAKVSRSPSETKNWRDCWGHGRTFRLASCGNSWLSWTRSREQHSCATHRRASKRSRRETVLKSSFQTETIRKQKRKSPSCGVRAS